MFQKKIYFTFFVFLSVGAKLVDHLHWDYCKKPKIAEGGLDISEVEIDPFPFLKNHEIYFNLNLNGELEMLTMGMVVYQSKVDLSVKWAGEGEEVSIFFKYRFEDFFHPGNYRTKIKLYGKGEVLRCLEFKSSYIDLEDLEIDL